MKILRTASSFILLIQLFLLDGAILFAGLTPTSSCPSSSSSTSSSPVENSNLTDRPFVLRKRTLPREMTAQRKKKAKVCPASLSHVLYTDLTEVRTLGSGQFGTVYQAKLGGVDAVIKSLKIETGFLAVEREFDRQRSAGILGAAPQVLGEVFCLEKDGVETFAFAMESYHGAVTLSRLAQDIQSLPEGQKKRIIQKVDVLAWMTLNKLHEGEIAHNDMAPENMLVIRASDSIEDIEKVLLIDFGVDDEHEGHPDYHANISLQVPPLDRDVIALLLIFLEMTKEYTPCSPKLEITEFQRRLKNSPWLSVLFKNEMDLRIKSIIGENSGNMAESGLIFKKDSALKFSY